ncbi:MAG: ABC transporter ATP-binding protein [Luteolibacter sp.]
MSDVVISVENLSKRYLVGHEGPRESYQSLRDTLARHGKNFARKTMDMARGRQIIQGDIVEEFWALKDVSFEVKRGEVLGIIGRNGAGKSTLLKILSRITEPSSGRVELDGRVASLLEVGTGFHPELTGRENIFLNGAILGMARSEIKRKFDEIVDFAGVEKFLDTPVKRYSSGMYVRLAFAVAAHLEPEILVVDEVLAVGDLEFQKKCLGKMQDVATKEGRTVLFVSHNMAAILQLTNSSLLLKCGTIDLVGPSEACVERYNNSSELSVNGEFDLRKAKRVYAGTGDAKIVYARYDGHYGIIHPSQAWDFSFDVEAAADIRRMRTSMTIFRSDGNPVGSGFSPDDIDLCAGEVKTVKISLKNHSLAPGHYYCGIAIGIGNHKTAHKDFDVIMQTLPFEVRPEEGCDGGLSQWTSGWGAIVFDQLEQKIGKS